MGYKSAKGGQEAIGNRIKYGHEAGLLGKALEDQARKHAAVVSKQNELTKKHNEQIEAAAYEQAWAARDALDLQKKELLRQEIDREYEEFSRRPCPTCHESIKKLALKCPHCGENACDGPQIKTVYERDINLLELHNCRPKNLKSLVQSISMLEKWTAEESEFEDSVKLIKSRLQNGDVSKAEINIIGTKSNFRVQWKLIEESSLNSSLLQAFCASDNPLIRIFGFRHLKFSKNWQEQYDKSFIDRMVCETDILVRMAIADNPDLPSDLIAKLAKEEPEEVQILNLNQLSKESKIEIVEVLLAKAGYRMLKLDGPIKAGIRLTIEGLGSWFMSRNGGWRPTLPIDSGPCCNFQDFECFANWHKDPSDRIEDAIEVVEYTSSLQKEVTNFFPRLELASEVLFPRLEVKIPVPQFNSALTSWVLNIRLKLLKHENCSADTVTYFRELEDDMFFLRAVATASTKTKFEDLYPTYLGESNHTNRELIKRICVKEKVPEMARGLFIMSIALVSVLALIVLPDTIKGSPLDQQFAGAGMRICGFWVVLFFLGALRNSRSTLSRTIPSLAVFLIIWSCPLLLGIASFFVPELKEFLWTILGISNFSDLLS